MREAIDEFWGRRRRRLGELGYKKTINIKPNFVSWAGFGFFGEILGILVAFQLFKNTLGLLLEEESNINYSTTKSNGRYSEFVSHVVM